MAARPRPNPVEYGNSKTTVHCCPQLNVRVHSSKIELAAAGLCVFGDTDADADGRRGLSVFGGLWVDMWRLVQQRWFLLFWLSLEFWPLLYQSSQVYQDCTNSVPIIKNNQKQSKTVKTAKITAGVPIVTCLLRVRWIQKVRVRVRRIHKARRGRLSGWHDIVTCQRLVFMFTFFSNVLVNSFITFNNFAFILLHYHCSVLTTMTFTI